MLSSIQRKATRLGERLSSATTTLQDKASRAKNRARICFHRLFGVPAQAHPSEEESATNSEFDDFTSSLQSSEDSHQNTTTESRSKSNDIRRIMRELDEVIANTKRNSGRQPPRSFIPKDECAQKLSEKLPKEYSHNLEGTIQLLDEILSTTYLTVDREKERPHLDEIRRLACCFGRQVNNTAYDIEYDVTAFQEEIRDSISHLEDEVTRSRAEAIVSKIETAGSTEKRKIMLMDLYKLGGEPDAKINGILFFNPIFRRIEKPHTLARVKYGYCRNDIKFKNLMGTAETHINSKKGKRQFNKLTQDYLDAPTTAARKVIARSLKALLPYDGVATVGLIMEDRNLPPELAGEVAKYMKMPQ
jgi:hypothetical protein